MPAAWLMLTVGGCCSSFASGRCALLPYQAQGGFPGLISELACGTCAFDQAALPFVPTILVCDQASAGKFAITTPGGPAPSATPAAEVPVPHRPRLGVARCRPARAGMPASSVHPHHCSPGERTEARAFAVAAYWRPTALRRTWRMRSS